MNKQIQLSAQPISNHECFTMLDLHENLTRLRTEADDGWKWELKDTTHGKVEWQDCFWDLYKDWGAQVIFHRLLELLRPKGHSGGWI